MEPSAIIQIMLIEDFLVALGKLELPLLCDLDIRLMRVDPDLQRSLRQALMISVSVTHGRMLASGRFRMGAATQRQLKSSPGFR